MLFMLAPSRRPTRGPATWTSLCGMTSLLPIPRWMPRFSETVCDTLAAPETPRDQAWQPRIWWRMIRTGPLACERAGAAMTSAPARAATAVNVRFMGSPLSLNRTVTAAPRLGIGRAPEPACVFARSADDGSGGKRCRWSRPLLLAYFLSVKALVAVTLAWPLRVSVALPVIFRLFAFFSSFRADAESLTLIVAFPAFEYERLPVATRIGFGVAPAEASRCEPAGR